MGKRPPAMYMVSVDHARDEDGLGRVVIEIVCEQCGEQFKPSTDPMMGASYALFATVTNHRLECKAPEMLNG